MRDALRRHRSFEISLVDCWWLDFRSWHLVDAFRCDAWSRYLEGCDLLVPLVFLSVIIAIAGMHYVGVAALQGMTLQYHTGYVLLSILSAIVASWTALWIGFFSRYAKQQMLVQTKVFFAFIMGIAISGMQPVGMLGLEFQMIPSFTSDQVIEPAMLLTLVSIVTLFLFIVFFASVLFDLQLRKRDFFQATILESTEDGVVTTNPDGLIQYANSLFHDFFPERHPFLTSMTRIYVLMCPIIRNRYYTSTNASLKSSIIHKKART